MNYYSQYFLDYHNLDQDMLNKEFISSSSRGNIEQMNYLCFSSELEIKADYRKESVILSCLRCAILLEKDDSLNFLINILKIQKTSEVQKILDEYKNPTALSMFLNRDMCLKQTTSNNKFKI